jgi:hypothetical protein
VYKLVAPLEQLTSMEEVTVRDKAVTCLIELSKGQPPSKKKYLHGFIY